MGVSVQARGRRPSHNYCGPVLRGASKSCDFQAIVLYHARHAFGTYAMAETRNPALVRDVMGHTDLRTTMLYQQPDLEPLRDAIDRRNHRVM